MTTHIIEETTTNLLIIHLAKRKKGHPDDSETIIILSLHEITEYNRNVRAGGFHLSFIMSHRRRRRRKLSSK